MGPPGQLPGQAKKGGKNCRTTHWVARVTDGAASFTWLLTATAFPLQSTVTKGIDIKMY